MLVLFHDLSLKYIHYPQAFQVQACNSQEEPSEELRCDAEVEPTRQEREAGWDADSGAQKGCQGGLVSQKEGRQEVEYTNQ